jgi:hypothetical protein
MLFRRFEEALSYFEILLVLCPADQKHVVHSCIGYIHLAENRVEDAIEHLQKVR